MPAAWLTPEWKPPASDRVSVVFVHGAIVNGWEMALLRHRMTRVGYQTRQFHYRSMSRGLDDNANRLREFIGQTEGDVIHVVGHSMGGIVIRQVFEQTPDPRPGRLVAIGSPFLDCWVAHRVHRFHHRIGPRLGGLTVGDHISRLGDPVWHGERDFGVIAGTYPFGIGSIFPSLPRPSDGVVLLEETKLQSIRDHVTYRINHFGMLLSRRCAAQIACFLATGAFQHSGQLA